jgi:hypothetical protein
MDTDTDEDDTKKTRKKRKVVKLTEQNVKLPVLRTPCLNFLRG